MWGAHTEKSDVPVFHDQGNGRRTIDVGHEGNAFVLHQQMELVEERGEDLRLLYVALTRATRTLTVVYADALPEALSAAALPGAAIAAS